MRFLRKVSMLLAILLGISVASTATAQSRGKVLVVMSGGHLLDLKEGQGLRHGLLSQRALCSARGTDQGRLHSRLRKPQWRYTFDGRELQCAQVLRWGRCETHAGPSVHQRTGRSAPPHQTRLRRGAHAGLRWRFRPGRTRSDDRPRKRQEPWGDPQELSRHWTSDGV